MLRFPKPLVKRTYLMRFFSRKAKYWEMDLKVLKDAVFKVK